MQNAKFLSCNQQVNNTIVNEAKWKKLPWISQYTRQLQAPCYPWLWGYGWTKTYNFFCFYAELQLSRDGSNLEV